MRAEPVPASERCTHRPTRRSPGSFPQASGSLVLFDRLPPPALAPFPHSTSRLSCQCLSCQGWARQGGEDRLGSWEKRSDVCRAGGGGWEAIGPAP